MQEQVKERLQAFGYEWQEGDEITLDFSVQKVENTIKNDCRGQTDPDRRYQHSICGWRRQLDR